ncbi:hypothetical protein GGR50DRAFT_410966 [Xylaria sp. CBS 124048]|nr:hypothetical protein GGR50DRAFT_410966 [Xylaria sp. CBS 124048]
MKITLLSLVAVLAATGTALPTNEPRQLPALGGITAPITGILGSIGKLTPRQLGALGGLTSPLTGILSQVGKHVPSTLGKLPGLEPPQKGKTSNSTQPATGKKAPASGPGGALGGLGGLGGL